MSVEFLNNFRGRRAEASPEQGSGAPAATGEAAVDGPASRREFWIIRGMLLGVAVILGGLEAYLNTVVFSDLVAVIGCVFSLISVVAVVFSSFLARSRDKGVRRIARVTDAVGIGMSAGVCCVWWYGASSIETAGDRVKEWDDSSALFVVASATANKNYESALDKYNNCRSRPVASLPAEDRAGALGACEEIAHSKSDFPVSVPDPGPRPTETRATVAAEWKPLIRKLGILGLAIVIGAIGTMGMCVSVAQQVAATPLEQAGSLRSVQRDGAKRWPELTAKQQREASALSTVRVSRMKKWPTRTGEVFGPFLPDWRPVFCHSLVLIEKPFPTPLRMAQSLEKGPSVWFRGPKEGVGKGFEVESDHAPAVADHDGSEETTMVADHIPTMVENQDEKTTIMVGQDEVKRKTTYICNREYKLVPRTDGGWKLQTGIGSEDICRLRGQEGDSIILTPEETQKMALSHLLMSKGKGSILWGKKKTAGMGR